LIAIPRQALVKAKTTFNAERGCGPNQRGKTGFRHDYYAYNAPLDHWLALLSQHDFKDTLDQTRADLLQLKQFWLQREQRETECRDRMLRSNKPDAGRRGHGGGWRSGPYSREYAQPGHQAVSQGPTGGFCAAPEGVGTPPAAAH
jgi:hypothetical protein